VRAALAVASNLQRVLWACFLSAHTQALPVTPKGSQFDEEEPINTLINLPYAVINLAVDRFHKRHEHAWQNPAAMASILSPVAKGDGAKLTAKSGSRSARSRRKRTHMKRFFGSSVADLSDDEEETDDFAAIQEQVRKPLWMDIAYNETLGNCESRL
jgi:hypothetical protein